MFAEHGVRYVSPLVSLGDRPVVPRQLYSALQDVIPGLSFNSGFLTKITTSYVTTFCTVTGAFRISLTFPWNVKFGNASTVKRTGWPE